MLKQHYFSNLVSINNIICTAYAFLCLAKLIYLMYSSKKVGSYLKYRYFCYVLHIQLLFQFKFGKVFRLNICSFLLLHVCCIWIPKEPFTSFTFSFLSRHNNTNAYKFCQFSSNQQLRQCKTCRKRTFFNYALNLD